MAGGTLIKLVLVALVCSSPVHASRRLQFFFPFGVTFTPPHSGPSAPAEGFPSWKCSFFGKFGIVPHFCQAPAPPEPSPSPEPVPSPSPEPESPSPAPPTDESPSPAPPTEESPSPAPPAEESPSPAPPAEESPSPAPPAEESPSPAPPAEESPSPAPPVEESPSPAPPVEESPSPAPPAEESPSPAPPVEESPSPVPPTPASPSPVPTPPASPSPIPTPPASPSPVPPRPSPSPVPAPTEVRIDPQGGSFSPTVAYERVCPPGTRVVSINGRGGDVLDAIGALICSNGIALPPVGGSGGSPVGHTAGPGGYLGIDVRAGTLLDAVTLVPASGASVTFGGGRGGGTAKPSLRCPANFRVAGIFGRQTPSNVITIGLVCRG